MEEALQKALHEELKPYGRGGGGCINSGRGYEGKSIGKIFVKSNIKKGVGFLENEFTRIAFIIAFVVTLSANFL
ncbi:unnamed protein product [Strongylus vulgaris]|uniref:Uncharacterized protein n=1 Tax=Strongylus vulgaris TaxID=40348 RepID=A0A3P7IIQ0_STRVU|nr:unnamed protein product [Strongylus vulgaris]